MERAAFNPRVTSSSTAKANMKNNAHAMITSSKVNARCKVVRLVVRRNRMVSLVLHELLRIDFVVGVAGDRIKENQTLVAAFRRQNYLEIVCCSVGIEPNFNL